MSKNQIVIYARVSTDEQSADAQLRDLREYVSNRGWSNVKEFVDEGISGSKDSRPAWNQLWDAMQKGRVKVLVVHALDRLGQSLPRLPMGALVAALHAPFPHPPPQTERAERPPARPAQPYRCRKWQSAS